MNNLEGHPWVDVYTMYKAGEVVDYGRTGVQEGHFQTEVVLNSILQEGCRCSYPSP